MNHISTYRCMSHTDIIYSDMDYQYSIHFCCNKTTIGVSRSTIVRMYFKVLTLSAIYAVILSEMVQFGYCENVYLVPAIMSIADEATILDRYSALSKGDYLYTSEMRHILQDGQQKLDISLSCSFDIIQVIYDLVISKPPKLYPAQSKCYYVSCHH